VEMLLFVHVVRRTVNYYVRSLKFWHCSTGWRCRREADTLLRTAVCCPPATGIETVVIKESYYRYYYYYYS